MNKPFVGEIKSKEDAMAFIAPNPPEIDRLVKTIVGYTTTTDLDHKVVAVLEKLLHDETGVYSYVFTIKDIKREQYERESNG